MLAAWVDPEEMYQIDLARVIGRYASRAELIVDAVRRRVREIQQAAGAA